MKWIIIGLLVVGIFSGSTTSQKEKGEIHDDR